MDDLTFIHPTRQGKMDEDEEKNYLVDDLTSIYPPRQDKGKR